MLRKLLVKYRFLFVAVLALVAVLGGITQFTGIPLGSLNLAVSNPGQVVVTAPDGGTIVTPAGTTPVIECGGGKTICTATVAAGAVVKLSMTNIPSNKQFGYWSGWCRNSTTECTFTMPGTAQAHVDGRL